MDEIIAEDEQQPEVKSKTQIKKELKELQQMGEQLVGYPEGKIKKLDLPEDVIKALLHARGLKKDESWRRQMQYIGKLLREIGYDAIKKIIDSKPEQNAQEQIFQYQLKQIADKLLNNDKDEMDRLIEKAPQLNIQQLRQMIRKTAKQKDSEGRIDTKPLIKYLKPFLEV